MKKKSFIIAALIIGMIACIASCKKKTTDPTPEPTPEPTEYVCTHDSLVYVAAVEPTGEENGCVEHYECPFCHAAFADAQGTIPLNTTILWATNYVIDKENVYESTFAEFAGDTDYLYRACLGMPGGVGDEGSLWPDYTGWQDWNEAQWQAYWNRVNEYYHEVGGEGDLTSGANALPALSAAGLITRVISTDWSKIDKSVQVFFQEDETGQQLQVINQKLDKIMKSIDKIQNALNLIVKQLAIAPYMQVVAKREEQQSKMHSFTQTPFDTIMGLIQKEYKLNNKYIPFSQLSAKTRERIANITYDWYYNSFNAENKFMHMLNFMGGTVQTQTTLPEAYDRIALRSNAWEHEAHIVMEMARAADAVLMCECYLMDIMFYNTNPGAASVSYIGAVNKKMIDYTKILKDHPVIRHNEYLCCIVPGEGVHGTKFVKDLVHLRRPSDYIDANFNKPIRMSNDDHVEEMVNWVNPYGFADRKWYKTVWCYYHDRKPQASTSIGIPHLDILRKVGFNIPETECYIVIGDKLGDECLGGRLFRNSIFRYTSNYWPEKDEMSLWYFGKNSPQAVVYIIKRMNIANGINHTIDEKGEPDNSQDYLYTLKMYKN